MEELKKINYEAGVTTHKDVRETINANVDAQNKKNLSYDGSIETLTKGLETANEGIQANQVDIARDHQTLNTVSANVTKLQSDVSSAQEDADNAQAAAETAQATGTDAKNTANTAQQTANEVARIQALTPSGTIPFDAVHEDGLTLESLDYDLEPVDLDADVVLGVTVELYPSATTGDKMRAKGVFVANLTMKGTPSSRRALNWKASAKYGVQDSRQYNNATRTGDATGYITDENFGQNGGIVHGNLFWCKADKKVYHYTTSTTNNYGVFVDPDASNALSIANEAKDKVNNIIIGGRNYAKNSEYKDDNYTGWSAFQGKLSVIDGILTVNATTDVGCVICCPVFDFIAGQQYTMSMDIRSDNVTECDYNYIIARRNENIGGNIPVSSEWNRVSLTFTPKTSQSGGVGPGFLKSSGKSLQIRNFKLELGNMATDWTPDPRDIDDRVVLLEQQLGTGEEFMKSMFLQFDEVQSPIEMASDNSMGYDIADPDAADSGITKANIILAQNVTYNGGTRAKGTFVAQFTTASGTKYALNWKHSSKLGLADSRYYNNAGANPFTSGTETDPTKYISDDATFKSTEFRGIRGENTYLCKGTGAVYVRDTQQTEWYKVVIDPSMWVESN